MKNLFFLVAALVTVSVASAQKSDKEHHHKDYSSYLPKKGDLATGVDLVGLVKFIGNSISDQKIEGNAITPFDGGNFAVKYFVSDNIALRARLGLNVSNSTRREFVRDDVAYAVNSSTTAKVTDTEKRRLSGFDLGFGIEFRRGIRRVQGYVGADAFMGFGSEKRSYEYGNAMTISNPYPSIAFGHRNTDYYGRGLSRYLNSSDKYLSGGLSIFTGVDYFISRGVSLGFEFGLSGYGSRVKSKENTYEELKVNAGVTGMIVVKDEASPKQNLFHITPAAGANLMFYF